MSELKIAVFAEAMTYPPKEGITAHVMSCIGSLSMTEDVRPTMVLSDRGFIDKSTIESFSWDTVLVPPEEFYDYDAMQETLDEIEPDILQAYNVYQARLIAAPYAMQRRLPLVMEHHDLEGSLAEFLGLPPDITNNNVRYQHEVAQVASLNRVMSRDDLEQLVASLPYRSESFLHLPVGVVDDFQHSRAAQDVEGDILFIGNCGYPPNRDAVQWILQMLAPKMPDQRFRIVGRQSDELLDEFAKSDNVAAYGMQDDLRPHVEASKYGIIPIAAGSGMKIKALTYLSAGLPVIATEIATAGIDNSPAIIETSLDEFAETIKHLDSTQAYRRLGSVAREHFLSRYEVGIITARLVTVLRQLRAFSTERPLTKIPRDDSQLSWIHEIRESVRPSVSVREKIEAKGAAEL